MAGAVPQRHEAIGDESVERLADGNRATIAKYLLADVRPVPEDLLEPGVGIRARSRLHPHQDVDRPAPQVEETRLYRVDALRPGPADAHPVHHEVSLHRPLSGCRLDGPRLSPGQHDVRGGHRVRESPRRRGLPPQCAAHAGAVGDDGASDLFGLGGPARGSQPDYAVPFDYRVRNGAGCPENCSAVYSPGGELPDVRRVPHRDHRCRQEFDRTRPV